MDKTTQARDILDFQVKRSVVRLFKDFLVIVEDLKQEHDESFLKLKKNLPEDDDLIDQADYLTNEKFEYIRKKILTIGNDCARNIESNMEIFDIEFRTKE